MPFVDSDGVRIHVEDEGHGPPVVLHTGGGGDLRMWRDAGYPDGLAGSRLLLMDHRGHGRSDRPRSLEQHRIDRYVADVIRVLDDAGVDRADFIGYSDGALVGYALSASRPDRIGALVAIGAIGGADEPMDDRRDLAEEIRRDGMPGLVRALEADEGDIPDWFVRQMLDTDPEMFALELVAWAEWEGPWPTFPRVQAPVLMIVGSEEEGPSGDAARHAGQAMARVRSGRSVVVPDLGHVGVFARAYLVLPHVRTFLELVRAS